MQPTTLLQLLWLTGAPPGSCTEPPRIASGVLALHGPVDEKSDYRLADIRELAQRSGKPLPHAPLGFYIAGLGHEIVVGTERQASPDGSRCDYLTTVTVRLSLVNRVIQVAADLDANGCNRDVALNHYLKHATADDRVLSQYVQTVNRALRDAWPQMSAKLHPSGHPDEDGVRQIAENVINQASDDFKPIRADAIATVDSPTEVKAVTCSSGA